MRVVRLGSISLHFIAAWCVAASAPPLFAQVAAREITGVVNDQARAAVPGATITVTNIDTNRQRVVTSSGDGVYAAPTLAPGNYRIDVQGNDGVMKSSRMRNAIRRAGLRRQVALRFRCTTYTILWLPVHKQRERRGAGFGFDVYEEQSIPGGIVMMAPADHGPAPAYPAALEHGRPRCAPTP